MIVTIPEFLQLVQLIWCNNHLSVERIYNMLMHININLTIDVSGVSRGSVAAIVVKIILNFVTKIRITLDLCI